MNGLMIVVPVLLIGLALLSLSSWLKSLTSPSITVPLEFDPLPSNDNTDPYTTHTDSANDNNLLLGRKWESSMFQGRRHTRQAGRNHCRKQSLHVNFADIGMDRVFEPRGYDVYNCVGECHFPLPEHLNGTNHAVLRSTLHSKNSSAVAKPCCVPISYSPITVLYEEQDNNYAQKTFQDMVVESCGCR